MKRELESSLKHKVADFQLILTLLNVMYGVFLGVFAQYLIEFSNHGSEKPAIHFLVCWENVFFVIMFFVYYIMDWFSANITLLFEKGTNHILLLFAIIFIFWLGFMMIISLDPNSGLLLSFGIYSAIVSSLDIELKYKILVDDEVVELRHSWKKYLFFVIRLLLSIVLIFFSILLIYNANEISKFTMLVLCYGTFSALIIAKLFRYFWLVYLKNNHDCLKSV